MKASVGSSESSLWQPRLPAAGSFDENVEALRPPRFRSLLSVATRALYVPSWERRESHERAPTRRKVVIEEDEAPGQGNLLQFAVAGLVIYTGFDTLNCRILQSLHEHLASRC